MIIMWHVDLKRPKERNKLIKVESIVGKEMVTIFDKNKSSRLVSFANFGQTFMLVIMGHFFATLFSLFW